MKETGSTTDAGNHPERAESTEEPSRGMSASEPGRGTDRRPRGQDIVSIAAKAVAGDPESQYRLGAMLLCGRGLPMSPERAGPWLLKAAMQGHAGAELMLGMMHHDE